MLILSSGSLPHYGLERVFDFAKKAKYDGIEIAITPENFDTQNPAYLKKLEKRSGVPIKAFALESKGEESILEPFQHTVREFPGATLNLAPAKVLSFAYKAWMSDLIPRLARKYDLRVCRRNVSNKVMFGFIPERTASSLVDVKEAGNVCLDLTVVGLANEEIIRLIPFLGEKLKVVYLSNLQRNMPYSLPQNGVLPVESFLTKLAQVRFRGDFVLRVNPAQLAEGEDEKVVELLIESREFFEKYFLKPQTEEA